MPRQLLPPAACGVDQHSGLEAPPRVEIRQRRRSVRISTARRSAAAPPRLRVARYHVQSPRRYPLSRFPQRLPHPPAVPVSCRAALLHRSSGDDGRPANGVRARRARRPVLIRDWRAPRRLRCALAQMDARGGRERLDQGPHSFPTRRRPIVRSNCSLADPRPRSGARESAARLGGEAGAASRADDRAVGPKRHRGSRFRETRRSRPAPRGTNGSARAELVPSSL